MQRLLTIAEAAEHLGIKPGSLRTAAEEHGFIVMMGRARRIDPETLSELIQKCRNTPNPQDYGESLRPESGMSATRARDNSQRALETAAKLKGLSRGSLRSATGQPAQVHRIK